MKRKLLLHTCCAPCLSYIDHLLNLNYDIICYFYNPNIHPFKEYEKRENAFKEFCLRKNIPIIIDTNESFSDWFDFVSDKTLSALDLKLNRKDRCFKCYEMRMMKTVQKSLELGINNISTTLLYSVYQYHDVIKYILNTLASKHNLNFIYDDFRSGWKMGHEIYKKEDLYRQNYCGCIFSEYERFSK